MDLTHGGDELALEYTARGNQVLCVDCYGTADEELAKKLEEAGVTVAQTAPPEEFDLIVAPVHCPDGFLEGVKFRRRITFHDAVGELVNMRGMIFEVTGTKGKTTTCHIITHLLRYFGRRIIQVTSQGILLVGDEVEVIQEKASIAPTSILKVSKMDIKWDNAVFEVSLGGTGVGVVGIITTLGDNYSIAAGTRTAFEGKVQMVRNARKFLVIPEEERELWEPHIPPGVWVNTFGPGGTINAEVEPPLDLGEGCEVTFKTRIGGEFRTTVAGSFLIPSYLRPMSAAMAGMMCYGPNLPVLMDAMKGYAGTPGRAEVREKAGKWIVYDRNPGVSCLSIETHLHSLESYYEINDIGLVVEPVSRNVCERLDMKHLSTLQEVHDCLTGCYLLGEGCEIENFKNISDISEVEGKHEVLLWCAKEGFR